MRIFSFSASQVYVYPHTDKRSKLIRQKSRFGIATLEFHSTKLKQWLDQAMEEYIKQLMGGEKWLNKFI